jgi:hypothetical protein
MGHVARISDHVATHSSGSVAIDYIAIEFASRAARAAANTATTAAKLREQLRQDLFDLPPLHLLALREIDRYKPAPLKKGEMAEFLFPLYADYHGWKNQTDGRLTFIQDGILEMADARLLLRDGHHYELC